MVSESDHVRTPGAWCPRCLGSHTQPRPFLRPALDATAAEFTKHLRVAADKAIAEMESR